MKESAKKRIIIWSIVSGVLIVTLIYGMLLMPHLARGVTEIAFESLPNNIIDVDCINTRSAEFIADDVNEINIYWVEGRVIVNKTNDTDISIDVYGKSTADEAKTDMFYSYDETDGTINIYSSEFAFDLESMILNNSFSFGSKDEEKTLIVNIPYVNLIDDFDIYTFSADVQMEEMNISNIGFYSSSGNIEANDIITSELTNSTVSGDINYKKINAESVSADTVSGTINIGGMIYGLSLNSVSGDCEAAFENLIIEYINIDSVSGTAKLILPETAGFTANVSSVSGKLKCDLNTKSTEDDGIVFGDGSIPIEMNSVSGNLVIANK